MLQNEDWFDKFVKPNKPIKQPTTKNTLESLQLEEVLELNDKDFEQELQQRKIKQYSSWLLPQLVAHFGTWRVLGTGMETVRYNTQTNLLARICWRLSRVKRSVLVPRQVETPQYGSLTPLILLGQRLHNSVSYESWRTMPSLNLLLEPNLYEALYYPKPDLTIPELLLARQRALEDRSGKQYNPETNYSLYGLGQTELASTPKLLVHMLFQTWLAHPKNQHPYMITNPDCWDQPLPQLIDSPLLS